MNNGYAINITNYLPSINNHCQNDLFKKNFNKSGKNFSPEINNCSKNYAFDISAYNPKSKALKLNSLYLSQNKNQGSILKISSINRDEVNSDKNNICITYYGGQNKNNQNNLYDNRDFVLTKRINKSSLSNQRNKNKNDILFGINNNYNNKSNKNLLLPLTRYKNDINNNILNNINKYSTEQMNLKNQLNINKNNNIDTLLKFYNTNNNNQNNNKKPQSVNRNTLNKSNRTNVFGNYGDNNILGGVSEHQLNKKICPLCHKEIDIYRYKFHISLHPSKIFNWLFLGSYRNACNLKEIKELGINYVLNCAIECVDSFPNEINYYHLKLNDIPSFNIIPFLEKATDFLNKAKTNKGIALVHCQLGISRSTSCVIAYMIKYMGYSTLGALDFIKKKRPQVMPNIGFLQQLTNYEKNDQEKEQGFN